eukprot:7646495-Karenia_brevis.AAC.1
MSLSKPFWNIRKDAQLIKLTRYTVKSSDDCHKWASHGIATASRINHETTTKALSNRIVTT